MIFTIDGLKRMLYTIGISIFICLATGYVFDGDSLDIMLLIKSILLGIAIWVISEIVLTTVQRVWSHKIFPSYAALFVIIAVGTSLGLYFFGVDEAVTYLIVCILAEIAGISMAIIVINRYKKKLNEKLKDYKKSD